MEEDVVVVLGMHNSGTSVIAHLLCLLGGFVGDAAEVLTPISHNLLSQQLIL
jgi:hypothetical protein